MERIGLCTFIHGLKLYGLALHVCVCTGYVMEWKFTCHKLLPKKLTYGIKFNLIEIVEEREDEIYILNVIS